MKWGPPITDLSRGRRTRGTQDTDRFRQIVSTSTTGAQGGFVQTGREAAHFCQLPFTPKKLSGERLSKFVAHHTISIANQGALLPSDQSVEAQMNMHTDMPSHHQHDCLRVVHTSCR